MMEILIIIIIVWIVVKKQKEKGSEFGRKKSFSQTVKSRPSAVPNKPKFSAVPNKPKKQQRTKAEREMEYRTRASSKACDYKAAYSKGRPDRLGQRGDYEPMTPQGMERVRCAYCGAENFVSAGSRDHYHCYFCWEKL